MKVVCVSKESYNQIWNNVTVGKIYDVIDKDTYPGEYVLKVDYGITTRHPISMFILLRNYSLEKLLE